MTQNLCYNSKNKQHKKKSLLKEFICVSWLQQGRQRPLWTKAILSFQSSKGDNKSHQLFTFPPSCHELIFAEGKTNLPAGMKDCSRKRINSSFDCVLGYRVKIIWLMDFPGGLVAKTPSSQCRGCPGSIPHTATKSSNAAAKRSHVP